MVYLMPVLGVILSFLGVLAIKPKMASGIKLLLAFSGAFLLSMTFFELVPWVYHQGESRLIALLILTGVIIQIFLEFFSKGAEHGHVHGNLDKKSYPIVLFLSLSLHSLLEGMGITHSDHMVYAVMIHKIPVAIILSVIMLRSKLPRNFTYLFILLFAIMTPLGSFMANVVLLIQKWILYPTAISIGIFLHISTVIIFESSADHSLNLKKIGVVLLGVLVAFLL